MKNMTLIPVKENIIRCLYHPDGLRDDAETVCSYPGKQIPDSENAVLHLCTKRLQGSADPETGEVIFRSADGVLLLQIPGMEFTSVPVLKYTTGGEKPVIERVVTVDGERNFIRNLKTVEDHLALRGRVFFRFEENEAIHGLGQGEEGIYNLRGHTRYLYQHNMRIPMPVLFSDRMYADGYFDKLVDMAVEAFFFEEPFCTFRDYFDVYSVAAVSKNELIAYDLAFETTFSDYGPSDGIQCNEKKSR